MEKLRKVLGDLSMTLNGYLLSAGWAIDQIGARMDDGLSVVETAIVFGPGLFTAGVHFVKTQVNIFREKVGEAVKK